MGSRKPYVFSNLTLTTLKTDKYEEIRWKNPWKVFKQGTLPIGLATAYQEEHGYDPLKACRLYQWLDYMRIFVWQWLTMMVITPFMVMATIDPHGIDELKPLLHIPVVRYAGVFTVCLVLLLIFTHKTYTRSERRMNDFQDAIHLFVVEFSSMFEDKSSVIKASMGKDELFAEVSRSMTQIARSVVEGEITGREVKNKRDQLKQKSSIANNFGLGSEWSIYFEKAQEGISPYEHFAWEI